MGESNGNGGQPKLTALANSVWTLLIARASMIGLAVVGPFALNLVLGKIDALAKNQDRMMEQIVAARIDLTILSGDLKRVDSTQIDRGRRLDRIDDRVSLLERGRWPVQ